MRGAPAPGLVNEATALPAPSPGIASILKEPPAESSQEHCTAERQHSDCHWVIAVLGPIHEPTACKADAQGDNDRPQTRRRPRDIPRAGRTTMFTSGQA